MKYTIDKTKGKKCKVEFSLDPQEWQTALEDSYLRNRDKYKIQGFRPGKAPRGVIEKHYGSAVFVEDAISAAFSRFYDTVLEENPDLYPVEVPSLDIAKLEPNVVFVAEFDTRPEVVLGKYKGNQLHDISVEISSQQVDDFVEKEAKKVSRKVDVDRPVQLGDTIVFDFSGSMDGVKFDGGTAKEFELEIGSGQFIPGFEEQLIGMQKGQQRDVVITFPEQYHQKSLAGKESVFDCKLISVKVDEVPKIDDAFAKDVSIFDTLQEYKADVLDKLKAEKTKEAKNKLDTQLLDLISQQTKIDIPQSMIDRQLDVMMSDFERMLSRSGMTMQSYLEMTGADLKDLRSHHSKQAEISIKNSLIVEELLKVENIQASEVDIALELEIVAKDNNMTIEQIEQSIKDGQLDKDRVVHSVKIKKLKEFLLENNTILPSLSKVDDSKSSDSTGDIAGKDKRGKSGKAKSAEEAKRGKSSKAKGAEEAKVDKTEGTKPNKSGKAKAK